MKGDIESIIGSQDKLKTIKHSLSFSFNKPQKPGSTATVEVHPGGKASTRIYNDLHSKFKNTSKFDMKAYAERNEDISVNDAFDIYVQVKIKMKKGVDKTLGQRIEAGLKEIQDNDNSDNADLRKQIDVLGVVCKTEGEYLCIGKHLLIPHKIITDKADLLGSEYSEKGMDWYFNVVDILQQISEVDQSLKVELDLGTTVKDVLNDKNAPYDEVCKGFSLSTSVELIRNLKKIIIGLIGDQEENCSGSLKKMLLGVSPLVLL